jgi:plastocyanin
VRVLWRRLRSFVGMLALLGGIGSATLLTTPAQAADASATLAQGPRTWHVSVGVETKDHAIQGMAFLPGEIWVNQGDTVVWTSHAGEIHTVTFLATGQTRPPFNPGDPSQVLQVGGSHYDGHSYFNSGLILGNPAAGLPTSYSLTFDTTGNFTFICLVHSMMSGTVHVRAAGTEYPFSQAQYDRKARVAGNRLLAHGRHLEAVAREHSNSHNVTLGIGDGTVMVARYIPDSIHIDVGDTVTFRNRDSETPHTVTFGAEPADGGFAPYGGHVFTGQNLNSGFLGADPHWFGTSISLTFATAGTYQFRCVLHDDLGMLFTVVVE